MPPDELENLIRFCHPRRILATTRLPGADRLDDGALAMLYGTSVERYREIAARLEAEACAAADGLRLNGVLAALADGTMPRVLTVGDSLTDDAQSWAELLRIALAAERTGVEVVNAGVSGDTTTAALARSARLPAAGLAIVLLGTNDARRHGGPLALPLVSDAATAANARALDALLRGRCRRVVWMTPPPVRDDLIERDPRFREAEVSWSQEDVARKAAAVRAAVGEAIDLTPAFGDPPPARMLEPDGLHPSLEGQRAIADALVAALESDAVDLLEERERRP